MIPAGAPESPEVAMARLLLRAGRAVEVEAAGASMLPTIPPQATLRLETPEGPITPRVGDVVSFVLDGSVFTHRLIAIASCRRERYALTRGDGCVICERPVPLRSVLGVVTAYRDGDRWLPLPRPPAGSPSRRAVAAVLALAVRSALSLHPLLAKAVVRGARWVDRQPERLRALVAPATAS